jgi:hypothetical protein
VGLVGLVGRWRGERSELNKDGGKRKGEKVF